MNGMVGNLLDMARLQTGPVSLRGMAASGRGGRREPQTGPGPGRAHPVRIEGLDALPLLAVRPGADGAEVFCNLFEKRRQVFAARNAPSRSTRWHRAG